MLGFSQTNKQVVPILVLAGWAMNRDLTLFFENFETICFFLSVLLVNGIVSDGLSNFVSQRTSVNRSACPRLPFC